MELAEAYFSSMPVLQHAISLMNLVLRSVEVKRPALQLVGLVCFRISLKYFDGSLYSLEAAEADSAGLYKKEDIYATELYILGVFNWNIGVATSAELTRELLYITGVDYDFARIIERSDAFAIVCYGDYGLAKYSPLEISIVSAICALEQYNQLSFRNQWISLLRQKVAFDTRKLQECKEELVKKLRELSNQEKHESLQCLMKDSLYELVNN